jgi:hypothetical protein
LAGFTETVTTAEALEADKDAESHEPPDVVTDIELDPPPVTFTV